MWLTILSKYKKHIGIATAIATAILSIIITYNSIIDRAYDKGFEAATVEIQLEHNKLIKEQLNKHTLAMIAKNAEYSKKLKANKSKQDEYWQGKLTEQKASIAAKHETEMTAARIKNDANDIDGNVSDDALELFKQAKRIISKPAY